MDRVVISGRMHTKLQIDAVEQWHPYLEGLGGNLRDKRKRASFAPYKLGLLSDGERKSVEPIAARACADPERTHAVHYQLIHFLGASRWKDEPVRKYAASHSVRAMETQGPTDHFEWPLLRWLASPRKCRARLLRLSGRPTRSISPPPRPEAKTATTRSLTRPELHFHDSLITLRIVVVCEILVCWLPPLPVLPERLFVARAFNKACETSGKLESPAGSASGTSIASSA